MGSTVASRGRSARPRSRTSTMTGRAVLSPQHPRRRPRDQPDGGGHSHHLRQRLEPAPGHAGHGPLPPHRADEARAGVPPGDRQLGGGQDAAQGTDKLLLERVVMKKGAFLQERGEEKKASMNSDELLDLLQSDISKDDIAQSGVVSDKDLARLLDRSGLESGKPFKGEIGKGFEVIPQKDGSSLLSVSSSAGRRPG